MEDIIISFGIVTYRVRDLLKDCLDSLYQNAPSVPFEVIVVDNHSEDRTVEMLRDHYPNVIIVENSANEGYTRPMNQALRLGRGRYLVQLNPDTLVLPGAFDCLLKFMDDHQEAGICTPKVLNRDGTLQKQCRRSAARPWDAISYFSGLSKRFPDSPRFARYLMTYLPEDQVSEVEAVSGSCMMIRRKVIEQIGYLDEQFFAYQEDADFCFRARSFGWKIFYVPQAQIIHYGGEGGSREEVYNSIYQWHRSYFIYYRKNLARDYFFLWNGFYYAIMGVKLVMTLGTAFLRKEKFAGTRKP